LLTSLRKKKFKFRYGGSFVGDYNQVLCSGGFFAYPELLDAPDGKYRLQFESNPIGYITERAGERLVLEKREFWMLNLSVSRNVFLLIWGTRIWSPNLKNSQVRALVFPRNRLG